MNQEAKKQFIEKQLSSLSKILELHKEIKDIDTSLARLYPVTIVEDDTFFVFDLDAAGEKYEFKLVHPTPMKIPKGVLASFALDFYDMKSSAIVSDEVFESYEGYVFIFHEFVHCFNGRIVKENLEIHWK